MIISSAGVNLPFVFLKAVPLLLIGIHAYLESRAAHRCTESLSVPAAGEQDYSSLWLISSLIFCLFELSVAYKALFVLPVTPLFAAESALGIAFFACGVFFRLSAIQELNAGFNTPPWAARELSVKTDGVFAQVRHPSELGLTLICLGLALAGDSLMAFGAFALVLFPLMLLRIRQEERWLMLRTGGAYAVYAASVPCLVPIFRASGQTPAR